MKKYLELGVIKILILSTLLSLIFVVGLSQHYKVEFSEKIIDKTNYENFLNNNKSKKQITAYLNDSGLYAIKVNDKSYYKVNDLTVNDIKEQKTLEFNILKKELKEDLDFSFIFSFYIIFFSSMFTLFYFFNLVFCYEHYKKKYLENKKDTFLKDFIFLSYLLIGLMFFYKFSSNGDSVEVSGNQDIYFYSNFLNDINNESVEKVDMVKNDEVITLDVLLKDGRVKEFKISDGKSLMEKLESKNIAFNYVDEGKDFELVKLIVPVLFIIMFILILRAMSGKSGSNKFSVLKKAPSVKLKDVKALNEDVKEEINEVIDLINMKGEQSNSHGGKLPKGALLEGPPGIGKTMLAKAIANETSSSFISISGSSFGGIFQGAGVKDVKLLFEMAKAHKPCIIFIDEFDSIGRKRGQDINSSDGDKTLNELLTQMDGFNDSEEIFVLAATNHHEKLDPAAIRSGRFDRKLNLTLPDYKGRLELLNHYIKNVKANENINLDVIAHHTTGFSGADIYNLVNEAALLATRRNAQLIEQEHFDETKDKLIMGHKLFIDLNKEEKELTAVHEAGHAVVAMSLLDKGHDPVKKVSIIPRGKAMGVTMFAPDEEKYSMSKESIESNISSLYGGRLAESLVFGDDKITTGASNDYQVATQYAEKMIKHYGLRDENLLSLGYKENAYNQGISEKEKDEMNLILKRNFDKAKDILEKNKDLLLRYSKALIHFEVIDEEQIEMLQKGEDLAPELELSLNLKKLKQ